MENQSFSSQLDKTTGTAVRPKPLPIGDYPAIVTKLEMGLKSKQKGTPFVRFTLQLTGWPDSVPEDERTNEGHPIDLTKKTFNYDLYTTDEAMFRVDEFLVACGVELGQGTYREQLQSCIGQHVVASVTQYMPQTQGGAAAEPRNEVRQVRTA